MAKLTFDLSGIGGLVERHQGDLNDTTSKPHLRYLGGDGQYADGIFNPIKKYGYMSPANNSYVTLTGTVAAGINSIQYDSEGDVLYFSETGENILKLDGMDDTSLANVLTITSTEDIKDMLIYEVGGQRALVYVIDSNTARQEATGIAESGGMYVGFYSIDQTEGATMLEKAIDQTSTNPIGYVLVDGASENFNTYKYRKFAQEFASEDLNGTAAGRLISGVSIRMRRAAGTGVGITLKASIQTPATASTGAFTAKGAWADATAYAINDTVTRSGVTYSCWTAHTSATAANAPGTGSSWETKWDVFGAPSGTIVASGTFALSDVPVLSNLGENRFNVQFSSIGQLSTGNYWIVIEEVGSNMTVSDQLTILGTINGTGIYDTYKMKGFMDDENWWRSTTVLSAGLDTMDFRLILNRDDDWSANSIYGRFSIDTGLNTYLYMADNGILYWVTGNKIHTLDGSTLGGGYGNGSEDVLTFSDYTTVPDITETRSRMYIAVQTSTIRTATDPRTFNANRSGVFVWDRRSQIQGSTDFYPTPGAKEIKALFTSSDGTVKAITVGNSGFTEIRGASGNQFAVLHTLEKDGYPTTRRAISTLGGLSVWLGANGIFYGYGSVTMGDKEALYKLGSMTAQANAGLVPGAIFVGNEYSSAPQQAVFFGWTDSDPSYVVQKWYPNGEGTINSVVQVAHTGDVYSLVKFLPELSKVNKLTLYCAPTTSTGSTVIATAKIYFNQSTSVGMTKSITQAQASRGYVHFDINKPNVNAIQIELEPSVSQTLGADDFLPSIGILDYSPTTTNTPDGG